MPNEYKCDVCGKPASVHITRIIDGNKVKIHLCAECAEKMSFSGAALPSDFLPKLKEFEESVKKTFAKSVAANSCPKCGADLSEMKKGALFSCPYCYAALGGSLDDLLKQMHSSTVHRGKFPKHHKVSEKPLDLEQFVEEAVSEKGGGKLGVSEFLSPVEIEEVQKQANQDIIPDEESKVALKMKLDKAISEERYEDAAAIRDELRKISKDK